MRPPVDKLAVIGQGLIGSSITRAVYVRGAAREVTVTDASKKVRARLLDLGIGHAKVVATALEAVRDADMVVICVPVSAIGAVAGEIAAGLKSGAILSDVGSVKVPVMAAMSASAPAGVHVVGAHPMAGTEFSGPDAGMPKLFVNRWCILTPAEGEDEAAVGKAKRFWEALGSHIEIMTAQRHDEVTSIISHLPHLIAFSIFHTGLKDEERGGSDVIKFSAGAFRDFTRIAASNPGMWRDIFLANRGPLVSAWRAFLEDAEACIDAIEKGDGAALEAMLATSRLTRRNVLEREHVSKLPDPDSTSVVPKLSRPYASDD